MKSLGAIVVGIGAYRYDRDRFEPLRYAAADAGEIFRYLSTCWTKPEQCTLVRISEAEATLPAVTRGFQALRESGPFDLQFVYLSGHGFIDDTIAGFLLQPPAGCAAVSLLECRDLDVMLASVQARRTVFILDCCFAEGIVRRMSFFGGLGDSDARLFIASSREHQRTWEDERVRHGVFTAHVLDLLNNGSSVRFKGIREELDVDSELFPALCDQVPLFVLEQKHARQEPVKGGISIRGVSLPVARSVVRRLKDRTAFGTAVRRLRQIVMGIVLGCLVFLSLAYAVTYYAEADRNGDIRLHHGTKWLAPAYRFLPAVRTDTGILSTDLSDDPSVRYAVQAGDVSGFWTQLSREGYRAWYDGVRSSLDPNAAARFDVLLSSGATSPVDLLKQMPLPSEVAFAAWALIDKSDARQIDRVLSHVVGADLTSPLISPFAPNVLDFDILDLSQRQLAAYADALRAVAAIDPDRAFRPFIGYLKAVQTWLAHSSPEEHGVETQRRAAEDVADTLAVIVKARADRGEVALIVPQHVVYES